MKKLLSLAALASIFVASQASAVSYNDYDILAGDGLAIAGGDSHSEWFNISVSDGGAFDNVGYDSSKETIVSASVRFIVGALGFGHRYYDVDLGSDDFVSGSFYTFFAGGADETGPVLGGALLALDSTGALQYTVTNNGSKSFSLVAAKLNATAEAKSVPDSGATLALFGFGMLGLVGLRRRFSK
ncbi:VPDSG-CTERM sorting domain-containing protein [Pelagicoccus sp. SDUM812002]|uniref:VPDSG-CTERM sorting domain-containing protein n=1 Tax=Pelagicoccus sp. SDUM812002 TaxID=3041266 RepID=UPI00280DDE3F|nr:VPDSG-CTERM sorting domain-containing protein [Pelagicoccus sp. SDUM812002]MDQ8188610.1 VPDSG-CTERM sorting domain-containing protein [Pelagicoccus sp. SDUM812002]